MNRGMYDDEDEVPGHGLTGLIAEDAAIERDRETKEAYAVGRHDAWEDYHRAIPKAAPQAPDPGRPTIVALTVCVMALILVVCLLATLRVGGAIAWDWAWVLAPFWVPVSVATVTLTLACIWVAALDERDATRRRRA